MTSSRAPEKEITTQQWPVYMKNTKTHGNETPRHKTPQQQRNTHEKRNTPRHNTAKPQRDQRHGTRKTQHMTTRHIRPHEHNKKRDIITTKKTTGTRRRRGKKQMYMLSTNTVAPWKSSFWLSEKFFELIAERLFFRNFDLEDEKSVHSGSN